ncbi:MAG: precorrin-6y C5,15-methyltransferase (decarboxylating) subunit CbiE [Acetobacter peroxydans]|nr:precorrin-6y C5,15-methyltransferase (decarboxylating) subunit CbiE [Acetobacter peroxydans]MCI2078725.1 precorrin-6y C5,15-methyltransferase (decarboxylating) subunit CbiE [Acetobacter peroxydans]
MSDLPIHDSVFPWLAVIGIGEDRLEALPPASRAALDEAEAVFGAPRHLALAGLEHSPKAHCWPVPFSVKPVLALRGRKVAVLASGDPFWYGAGASLCAHLAPGEWRAYPAPSTFSWVAARMGWRLEETPCLGLHAAPFERLVPLLHHGGRAICLLRDGKAPEELAQWLDRHGFGPSTLHVMEALGGAYERVRTVQANSFDLADIQSPVVVALSMAGNEPEAAGMPQGFGLPDALFDHDGQITKRPMRALTLSALAPRRGELLWDLGAGSGSISVEWCLAGGLACAVERAPERCARIHANATRFGVEHRLSVVQADTAASLPETRPSAIFIGGGANEALMTRLWELVPEGTRFVVNAVTLETETLLATWHARVGGSLLRIELADSQPLGRMRGWSPARPVVQWSVTR